MDPAEKQVRREEILDAARILFAAGDGSLPGAGEIATAAGLAKGTVYLYFRTKEEIFMALLSDGIRLLLGEIEAAFQGVRANAGREEKVAAFLAAYVASLVGQPEMLQLDGMCYVMEKNLTEEKLREFKLSVGQQLESTGKVIEKALRLPEGRGVQLLVRTFAMTRGLWQATERKKGIRMNADASPAWCYPEFAPELAESLAEYWRGALRMK
jgi:AcrR family transcriptional regulator